MSVTNACEDIATRIVQDFGISPQRTIFIEHYPESSVVDGGKGDIRPETFDQIVFNME
jgi:hypothetical protein